jgi:NAD(P)-dependent dehydrogenase (short-subunit alcohol dehydrogenase family)
VRDAHPERRSTEGSNAAVDRLRFDGRAAIVTGAGKGLGRCYAEELAARGARVLVNNRVHDGQPSSADQVVEAICARGGDAVADTESVEGPGAASRLIGHALDAFGRLDVLICNAGVSKIRMFHKMDLEEIRQMVEINLMAPMAQIHAALPHMRKAGYGRILTISSNAAMYGAVGFSTYAATKSAMHGLVAALSEENRSKGIHVNALVPFAFTAMSEAAFTTPDLPEDTPERMDAKAVAGLAAWLVSRECEVTGKILAGGGRLFRRVRMVQNTGLESDDSSPENLAAHREAILEMDELVMYEDSESMIREFVTRARADRHQL